MTLDEAIKHAENVAELNEWYDKNCLESMQCKECAEEHRQLAEWLKELKDYKERMPSWEEYQKQFAVGDEVYSDAFDDKGIITHITADKVACVCIICNGSTMMKVGTNGLHKTGRHFNQIADVLAEMIGEKMTSDLTTYQIYLMLLGYLTERHDDTRMLRSILVELYRRADKTESEDKE